MHPRNRQRGGDGFPDSDGRCGPKVDRQTGPHPTPDEVEDAREMRPSPVLWKWCGCGSQCGVAAASSWRQRATAPTRRGPARASAGLIERRPVRNCTSRRACSLPRRRLGYRLQPGGSVPADRHRHLAVRAERYPIDQVLVHGGLRRSCQRRRTTTTCGSPALRSAAVGRRD
jgi:hypothetical protein